MIARYCHSLVLASLLLMAQVGFAEQQLNVVSWDGAYVKSQILGFIRPWEEATGVRVNVIHYNGGIDEIRRQVRAWNVGWDVVDLELFDAIQACEEGLLEPIDHSQLPAAPDGTAAAEDFISSSLMPCGVGNVVGATVVAYDKGRLATTPTSVSDLFNLRDYPGRRALRRTPQGNLEWALVADGVPREQVYRELSTPQGLDRAFAMLDRLKHHVEWWRSGEEAIRLLETGQVVMAAVYSGRVPDAVARGANLEILWDHQLWVYDVWGIPKHGRNTELAMDFVRFATSTASLARQASHIPYGPVRQSSLALLAPEVYSQLPTAPHNLTTAIALDANWWARNQEAVNQRFERWLERPVRVPRELPR